MTKAVVQEAVVPQEKRLYVIRVFTGHEEKVKAYILSEVERLGLQDKIGEIVIPTQTVIEMRQGKRRSKVNRLFPGYIFVEMILDPQTRELITTTPSVMGFADNLPEPLALTPEEESRLKGRILEKSSEVLVEIPFQIDDRVKITDGPFKDFVGTVKEIYQERRKLKILVSIFGRQTPVEVDFLQVTTNFTT
ncbi:MAG: transcription termination/antitermination protein NusG [bacterium]